MGFLSKFTDNGILPSAASGSVQKNQHELFCSPPFLWPFLLLQHWHLTLSQTFATLKQALLFLQESYCEIRNPTGTLPATTPPAGWGNPGQLTAVAAV